MTRPTSDPREAPAPLRTLRIAGINSHDGMNGVTTNCVDLYNGLAERGHQVSILHRPGAWISTQVFHPNCTLIPMHMGKSVPPRAETRRVADLLRAREVDIIHTHGSQANTVGAFLRLRRTAPVVSTAHAMIANVNLKFVDGVIVLHDAARTFYQRRNLIPSRRLHMARNVFDRRRTDPLLRPEARSEARRALGLSDDAFALGVIGQVCTRKRQSLAVDLTEAAVRKGVDAHCILIGEMDSAETTRVRERCARSDMGTRVMLLGRREDARALMAGLDLVVCSSVEEQSPIAVLEGMALAKPILSTDVGNIRDLVRDGENGMIFAPGTLDKATAFISGIASDRERRDAMGRNSLARLTDGFVPAVVLPRIEEIYASVIAGYPHKPG